MFICEAGRDGSERTGPFVDEIFFELVQEIKRMIKLMSTMPSLDFIDSLLNAFCFKDVCYLANS